MEFLALVLWWVFFFVGRLVGWLVFGCFFALVLLVSAVFCWGGGSVHLVFAFIFGGGGGGCWLFLKPRQPEEIH